MSIGESLLKSGLLVYCYLCISLLDSFSMTTMLTVGSCVIKLGPSLLKRAFLRHTNGIKMLEDREVLNCLEVLLIVFSFFYAIVLAPFVRKS